MDLSAIGMLKLIFDNGPDYESVQVDGYEISFIKAKRPIKFCLMELRIASIACQRSIVLSLLD